MIYLIVILTALFQATLANLLAIGNIRPDLLLVIVVFVALHKGPIEAAKTGIAAGFLKDILSAGAFLNTSAFFVLGITAGLFSQRFYKEKISAGPLVVLGSSVIVSIVYLFWFSGWEYPPSIAALALRVAIPTALYTTLAALPMFAALKKCGLKFYPI